MSDSRGLPGHPTLLGYAVLACLFGWVFVLFGTGEAGLFPLGPLLAAAVVSTLSGRIALRRWGRQLATLRGSAGWYLLAVAAPIVIMGTAVLVNGLFGAPLPTATQLSGWSGLGPTYLMMLIAVGIGEEAGWMAFAAPLLLRRHRFVVAWLVLAAIRIVWHVPLMISGDLSPIVGIGGNLAFQLLMLWLFQRTGVWILAAVWHGTLNTVGGQFLSRMAAGADGHRLDLLMVSGYAAVAIVVALADRRRLSVQPRDQSEPPARF